MAMPKVFAITEVLELILLALPMRDLLLSQRVCKSWKDTVAGSRKLQKALFIIAESTGTASRNSTVTRNPLLEPLFPPRFYFARDIALIDADGKITLHPSWKYPEASWQSMLLTTASVEVCAQTRKRTVGSEEIAPGVPVSAPAYRSHVLRLDHTLTARDMLEEVKAYAKRRRPATATGFSARYALAAKGHEVVWEE